MITISLMENAIQNYAWGSRSAIAEIMGIPHPTRKPQAELWMGAHPGAPSRILVDGAWVPLNDLVVQYPDAVLGRKVRKHLGEAFPFLLKILASEQPLSIQAHPDARRAREGFDRENRAGIDRMAENRNYRDPNSKPECIVALTPFWALNGFRPAHDAVRYLSAVAGNLLNKEIQELAAHPNAAGVKLFFVDMLARSGAEKKSIIQETIENARRLRLEDAVYRWILQLHRYYPEDIGLLGPAFLNLVRLAPGQAMFLDAGRLHAYLKGTGIEIMGNSDNVLRGGLTPKHVDADELIRVLHFEPGRPGILTGKRISSRELVYESPVESFRLSRIQLHPEAFMLYRRPECGPEILLCTQGAADVFDASTETGLVLPAGRSLFVPDMAGSLQMKGNATLYRATVNLAA